MSFGSTANTATPQPDNSKRIHECNDGIYRRNGDIGNLGNQIEELTWRKNILLQGRADENSKKAAFISRTNDERGRLHRISRVVNIKKANSYYNTVSDFLNGVACINAETAYDRIIFVIDEALRQIEDEIYAKNCQINLLQDEIDALRIELNSL